MHVYIVHRKGRANDFVVYTHKVFDKCMAIRRKRKCSFVCFDHCRHGNVAFIAKIYMLHKCFTLWHEISYNIQSLNRRVPQVFYIRNTFEFIFLSFNNGMIRDLIQISWWYFPRSVGCSSVTRQKPQNQVTNWYRVD